MTVSEFILALKSLEDRGYGGHHVLMDGESDYDAGLWPIKTITAYTNATERFVDAVVISSRDKDNE